MNTTTRVALLAACIAFLAGCSNSVLSSPDSAVFDGIDPAVVSEVLENPAVRIKVERAPKEIQPGFAQSIAINFIVCRDYATRLPAMGCYWHGPLPEAITDSRQPGCGNHDALGNEIR